MRKELLMSNMNIGVLVFQGLATRWPKFSRISRLVATWGDCTEGYRCQPNNTQCRQCYSRFSEREGRGVQ